MTGHWAKTDEQKENYVFCIFKLNVKLLLRPFLRIRPSKQKLRLIQLILTSIDGSDRPEIKLNSALVHDYASFYYPTVFLFFNKFHTKIFLADYFFHVSLIEYEKMICGTSKIFKHDPITLTFFALFPPALPTDKNFKWSNQPNVNQYRKKVSRFWFLTCSANIYLLPRGKKVF